MSLKLIGKMSLIASLLTVSSVSFAEPTNPITCPSISSIQQAADKLDSVYKFDDSTYIVYTSKPAFTENTKDWTVAAGVMTKKKKDALKIGKSNVRNTSQQQNTIAEIGERGDVAVCYYGKYKDVIALTALEPTDLVHSLSSHVKAHE